MQIDYCVKDKRSVVSVYLFMETLVQCFQTCRYQNKHMWTHKFHGSKIDGRDNRICFGLFGWKILGLPCCLPEVWACQKMRKGDSECARSFRRVLAFLNFSWREKSGLQIGPGFGGK